MLNLCYTELIFLNYRKRAFLIIIINASFKDYFRASH